MFEERPDLLRSLSNRANQANGARREALAGAVAAFATTLVERPGERPDAVLGRIAHQHASLGITAGQYTLVGRHLPGAVGEVLGDAVTPEVGAARDEVHRPMANALIALEARLYAGAGVGNGAVRQDMEIADRVEESVGAASLGLRRPDGDPTGPFIPGRYVSVQVELPDGAKQLRQYSLSTAPGRKTWRIAVKRERSADCRAPEGEVSSWLHAHARPGDIVKVSPPFGDLVLPEGDGPLLLASAGIGVTPMLSLADTASERHVTVLHADRSPARHAHRPETEELVGRLPNATLHVWYETPPGAGGAPRPRGPGRRARLALREGVSAFLCGPLPFVRSVRGDLLTQGVGPKDVHYEVFGPDLWLSK